MQARAKGGADKTGTHTPFGNVGAALTDFHKVLEDKIRPATTCNCDVTLEYGCKKQIAEGFGGDVSLDNNVEAVRLLRVEHPTYPHATFCLCLLGEFELEPTRRKDELNNFRS